MDGPSYTNRIDHTTERDLYKKVVDNVLVATTMASRMLGMGETFNGKQKDYTVTITEDDQFQWGTGLIERNSSAVDNTIELSYAMTMGTQPKVQIDFETFANDGELGTIPLDAFKYKEAAAVATQKIASAFFGAGVGDQPNGLDSIADDGVLKSTIGGQSKTTYSVLQGEYTDSNGTMSLAKLADLDDAISASASREGSPTIKVTDKDTWSDYEELLTPFQVMNFQQNGMPRLPVHGQDVLKPGEAGAHAGFTTMFHRQVPVIKDDSANDGSWYSLNERTFGWAGKTKVPRKLSGRYEKVDFGQGEGYESSAALKNFKPNPVGWFYRKEESMITQLGAVAYFVVMGQVCAWEPRRNGQLYDITGIE